MSIPVPPQSKLEIERQRYKSLLMNSKDNFTSMNQDKASEKDFEGRNFYNSYNHAQSYSPQSSPSRKLHIQSLNITSDPIDSLLDSPAPKTSMFSTETISNHFSSSPPSNSIDSPSNHPTQYSSHFSNDDKDNVIILLQVNLLSFFLTLF